MSHKATVWAFGQKLPALAKLVLLALADRHNGDTGRCDPSMDRVADDCGMSRDSVKRQVKVLVEKGLVRVHERKEGPVQLTNFYSFKMEDMRGVGAISTGGVGAISTPNQEVFNQEVIPGRKSSPERDAIRRVFLEYLKLMGKSPKLYTLNDHRMDLGLRRLAECRVKSNGDLAKAEDMMLLVVETVAQSDFHMGKNPDKKNYNDWDAHIFKSGSKVEFWIDRAVS